MRGFLIAAFGIAALFLIGLYGYQALFERQVGFPLSAAAEPKRQNILPTEPEDWQGQIDYQRLDRKFAAVAERPEMAGLAVAIVEDGDLRFIGTYGVADKRSSEPVKLETVFRWASVSKGVAGTLAAKLAAQGALDLDSPISTWRTSLRLPGGANDRITLRQLLSHQTGLTKNAYDRKLEDGESPGLLRASLGTAPLQCIPGTCHSYQNIAFDTASEILGHAAGTLYSDAVQEQLFTPLGMGSARFGLRGLTSAESWARPHRGDEVRTLAESYFLLPAAAGASSNIVDLARWLRAQMGENADVITSAELAASHAPIVRTGRVYGRDLARALTEPSYGLGWRRFVYRGRLLVGHSGAVDGYRATLIFDPISRTGVAAMWNSNWGRPFELPFAVLDSYYGVSGNGEAANDWLDLSDLPLPVSPPPVGDNGS
ncbi:MAG: serine hydrolase domain-containing protein [Pseudomonadota bacterium]